VTLNDWESPMAQQQPAKATLTEKDPVGGSPHQVTVQFNPENLKVSYSNQIVAPKGEGNPKEKASLQHVGAGVTKLSLVIWFDVTGESSDPNPQPVDVRKLTNGVTYFITPRKSGNDFVPPLVEFKWGTFTFEGIVESLEESLEFFSSDGVPLRASMSLNMVRQKIEILAASDKTQGPPPGAGGGPAAGTQPLTPAQAGGTLQGMAAGLPGAPSWQAIAAANGIENPRLLSPGQLVNLNVSAGASASASVRLG